MKPVHSLFNTSLSTKQRLLEKRDNLKCDIDAASLTATLYSARKHNTVNLTWSILYTPLQVLGLQASQAGIKDRPLFDQV